MLLGFSSILTLIFLPCGISFTATSTFGLGNTHQSVAPLRAESDSEGFPLRDDRNERCGKFTNSIFSFSASRKRNSVDRRLFLDVMSTGIAATITVASPVAALDVGGTTNPGPLNNVDPFNGLIFNYRRSDFSGSNLPAGEEDENGRPTITYKEFLDKLSTGDVTFVEFIAPNGDVAYATMKGDGSKEEIVRIGEGYPVELNDGWSSPSFVIRTVEDKGVPYKFVVPGLAANKLK